MRARVRLPLLLVLSACVPHLVRDARREEGRYLTGAPGGDGWRKVQPGGADQAWWNPALGATIYADANCGARFQDGELSTLSDRLLYGLVSMEEVRRETLGLDGREALLRVAKGKLDGVQVQVGVVVLNKDACTFDIVYVAGVETYERGEADFRAVYQGFRKERR